MALTKESPSGPGSGTEPVSFHDIPGPGVLAWFGTYLGILGENPARTFAWLRDRYGEVIRLYLPLAGWTCIITQPDHVQYVLEDNQKNYRKSADYQELKHVMGEGLLTSEGDKWLQQHRLMMPMFHKKSIKNFGDMIVDETRSMMRHWEEVESRGESIDLLDEMKRITLKIICRALFSSDVSDFVDDVSEDLETLRTAFRHRVRGYHIPLWIPTPMNWRANGAIDRLNDIVNGLINDRRGNEEDYEDFLSMLMLAKDEETGETMGHNQVRDEVMTFFLAGHETTANALTWTWYALNNNPQVHSTLHDEVSETLDEDFPSFSWDLYEELEYPGRVIDESMRKYPPVPVFGREAIEEDQIDGYEIPEGTNLMLSQYLIHRDPEVWEDPMAFQPERFAGDKQENRHRYSYFPFGGGARMCIGRDLALLEARIIISLVVNEYRLVCREPDRDVGEDVAVTMSPADPIEVNITRW